MIDVVSVARVVWAILIPMGLCASLCVCIYEEGAKSWTERILKMITMFGAFSATLVLICLLLSVRI